MKLSIKAAVLGVYSADPNDFANQRRDELDQALTAKVNVLLLENFPPGQVRQAIALVQGRAKVEVTGKVGLDNARAYALAGVDYISVSQLTQSVKAFDFSFRVSR